MKEFKGIIPPVITPLTATRELDIAGLERLIEHMISGGIHGLFVLGTTGEGPAVGYKVQQDMVKESIRIVNNRIPILVGISSAACQESVEQAQFAFECKANGVVAAPPCYFNLGEPELFDYYKYLAETSKLPLFVYNMPSMTKVYMKPSLVKKLAEIPNIRGYKDSSANMPDFHEVLLTLKEREDFSIFVGPEELLGESVLFGADGGVSGGANLNPEIFVGMYNAAINGDVAKMQDFQQKIYAQRKLYSLGSFQSSMIKGLKSALAQKGICQDYLAAPFNHFEKPHADEVKKILDKLA